ADDSTPADPLGLLGSATAGSGADYAQQWAQDASQMLATTNPDDLLDTATTNLTDANDVLAGIDTSGNLDLDQLVAQSTGIQDGLLQQLGLLESAEDTITSNAGS